MLLTGNKYNTKEPIVLMLPFRNTSVTPVMLKILVTYFAFKSKGRRVKLGLHRKLLISNFDFKKQCKNLTLCHKSLMSFVKFY